MATVHMILGSLVLIGYLALAISYWRGAAITRQLSMAAGAAIVVQWALGFVLLISSDDRPNATHYIFALATILTVGFEHSVAVPEKDAAKRKRLGTMAATGTFALALVAYLIGDR